MKTLREQLKNRCVHFNGIMNKECGVGVRYEDVRVDRPYKFPCLKIGGVCSQVRFPTEVEIIAELNEIEAGSTWAITTILKIRNEIKDGEHGFGTVPCDCGGNIHYSVAQSNGHIRAICSKCNQSIIE